MQNCPMCFSEISDDNPALVARAIEKANLPWHQAESDRGLYGWPVGKKIEIDGVGEGEVIAKKINALASEFEEGYYEGGTSLPQGTTFEAFVVLKVGDHFFKKTGEGDSYSDITWAGLTTPVIPKEKTVVVYDF